MVSRLRGNPGFLSGFSLAHHLPPVAMCPTMEGRRYRRLHGQGPIVINDQGSLAVTVGNGNVVQQQSTTGSGPVAQQQVSTMPIIRGRRE
jgi:hypothetical protein